jgi:hypothetical protein
VAEMFLGLLDATLLVKDGNQKGTNSRPDSNLPAGKGDSTEGRGSDDRLESRDHHF